MFEELVRCSRLEGVLLRSKERHISSFILGCTQSLRMVRMDRKKLIFDSYCRRVKKELKQMDMLLILRDSGVGMKSNQKSAVVEILRTFIERVISLRRKEFYE